ncbi:DUF1989 domain-containing protein [Nocardioides massiliensis]|uniref:Uncharacterized protein YcgI (DUF1989 family) n=1 Tax=Nocardioides massiliensis TaxID=1325935 RepID=A0ABT9NN24_9ACTN|nr:urea carboxylase-associated family protein [Nocardioides massiliensis]MDP9821815.1 uncharacterized protein YcgI (DUF1989 family) [Nocardioides massiliensis]
MDIDVVIPPRGFLRARLVPAGACLRITDLGGRQAVDVMLRSAADTRDWLSCIFTTLLNGTDRITTGHVLYSKAATPLATVTQDDVGRHWFGGGFCSEETNRFRYGVEGTINCRDNLAASLADWVGHPMDLELDACASLFMAIAYGAGRVSIEESPSRPGSVFELRAETDLLVGLSNCPADRNPGNGFQPSEVRVQVGS